MQSELGVDHPPLWTFIDSLKTVQKGRDSVYEDYVSCDTPPKKRRKYQEVDERIKRIVDSYFDRNIIEYLRGLAHNFLME